MHTIDTLMAIVDNFASLYRFTSHNEIEKARAALQSALQEVLAERDALAVDAARYRWLWEQHCCDILETILDIESGRRPQFELDAAIDAVM